MKDRVTMAELRAQLDRTADRFGIKAGIDGLDIDRRAAGLCFTWREGRELIPFRLTAREATAALLLAHELIRLKEGWED